MSNSENGAVYYEAGQALVPMVALTDDGGHQTFESAAYLWSMASGKEPAVHPDGLMTGGAVTPGVSGTNNKIDVAGLTAYLAGVLTTVVAAADETVTRAVAADTHIINSVTITSAGAVAILAGTDGVAFSETRAAAGGPPLIPVGDIEIAQVRMTSNVAAPVTADEIFAVEGQHCEMSEYPTWVENIGPVENGVPQLAGVTFQAALPLSHVGPTAKAVYAQYYAVGTGDFARAPKAMDMTVPEESRSVSSEQFYGGVENSVSTSLGQGGFTALCNDGITDPLIRACGDRRWVKFFQNIAKTPHVRCNGFLAKARSWPAGGSVKAAITVSAMEAAQDVRT